METPDSKTKEEQRWWQQQFEAKQGLSIESTRSLWCGIVKTNIAEQLQKRLDSSWSGNDDDIFGAHTAFIKFAINHSDPLPAIQIWENEIAQAVCQAEAQLSSKGSTQSRIHKGAPLFNVGVACYVAGDFERAFCYVAEAGEENHKSGRGSPFPILIGDDPLSRRFLIKPLVKRYLANWSQDYQSITGRMLDEAEFVALLKHLAQRPADAVQLILALHRFFKSDLSIENHATRHIRTRAVAEALVALDSCLRRFQPHVVGELDKQLKELIAVNSHTCTSYQDFHDAFCRQWPSKPQRRTAPAVNWSTTETQTRLAMATTHAQRAGTAAYLALRLRNSLLHVVEDTLEIFQRKALCERCMGLALAVTRLAMHGEQGTIATL